MAQALVEKRIGPIRTYTALGNTLAVFGLGPLIVGIWIKGKFGIHFQWFGWGRAI